VEPAAPPPQFTDENASAKMAKAPGKLFHENFLTLFSQEIAVKMARSQALARRNRDMYHQHLVESF
jgi:hypothetical protein